MENILIRKATIDDAIQYINLKDEVWCSTYKHIFPKEVFNDMNNRKEDRIKNFMNNFNNNNEKIYYVAENNGNLVGLMYGIKKSSYEYFSENEYADLVALYIKPEYQGLGIGKKFKNIFENWAKENGAKRYVIGVLKDNKKARNAYEKWGGKLNNHEQLFYRLGVGYNEVFYTFEII